jgi:hypothetical protein
MGFTATIDAVVEVLRAAGLEAAADARDLNPPAIRVTPAELVPLDKLCGSLSLEMYLDLVARDSGDRPVLDQLEFLYDSVRAQPAMAKALVSDAGTFTRTRTTSDPTGLPTLRLTIRTPITTT